MIAATYDCGCMPPKITHLHPNCSKSFLPKQTQLTQQSQLSKYTVVRCQTAPPPSCPNTSCCKLSHHSPTCRSVISSCQNFDKIYDCTCSSEPPILSDDIKDCNCESKDIKEEECNPTKEKTEIISKIAKKGLPYKEIEAIINNNRMIIRMQKELIEDEYEPPCDCPDGPGRILPTSSTVLDTSLSPKYRNDIIYQMQDLCKQGYKCTGQNSMIRQSCDQDGKGGRTIMLYPHPGIKEKLPDISQEEKDKDRREKKEKMKISKQIDLEENPNIFVLRIRKQSKDNDGKHKFDLEFRTPRPWLTRKESIKCPHLQSKIHPEQTDKTTMDSET
ncbi:uncharacterized protein LOC118440081 [Vespa mandarinia]|uniref:uncharacterized protein LOC118440081 n=1 Tax=Vespa mandarinia TaxID=7446 RepID=UPI0016091ADF|nr:uncharacterized protein LOC118440081 [Vespa mandarinia]